MELSLDNKQFSFKDGNLAFSKFQGAVQVFYQEPRIQRQGPAPRGSDAGV